MEAILIRAGGIPHEGMTMKEMIERFEKKVAHLIEELKAELGLSGGATTQDSGGGGGTKPPTSGGGGG